MPNATAATPLSSFVCFVWMRFGDDFLASLSDSDSASGFILNTLKCCSSTFLVVRVNCRQLFNRFALICGDRLAFSRSIFMRSIWTSKLTKLSKIVPAVPSSNKIAVRHLHRSETEKERDAKTNYHFVCSLFKWTGNSQSARRMGPNNTYTNA